MDSLYLLQVAMLFKKYQLDFELYGYNPESYLDIAIQEIDWSENVV